MPTNPIPGKLAADHEIDEKYLRSCDHWLAGCLVLNLGNIKLFNHTFHTICRETKTNNTKLITKDINVLPLAFIKGYSATDSFFYALIL
jgi:hypothetical protein